MESDAIKEAVCKSFAPADPKVKEGPLAHLVLDQFSDALSKLVQQQGPAAVKLALGKLADLIPV